MVDARFGEAAKYIDVSKVSATVKQNPMMYGGIGIGVVVLIIGIIVYKKYLKGKLSGKLAKSGSSDSILNVKTGESGASTTGSTWYKPWTWGGDDTNLKSIKDDRKAEIKGDILDHLHKFSTHAQNALDAYTSNDSKEIKEKLTQIQKKLRALTQEIEDAEKSLDSLKPENITEKVLKSLIKDFLNKLEVQVRDAYRLSQNEDYYTQLGNVLRGIVTAITDATGHVNSFEAVKESSFKKKLKSIIGTLKAIIKDAKTSTKKSHSAWT